jgi:hypothetical protein
MTLDQINERLDELKDQKTRVQGMETEVYARIVGYYRSVRNWNKGKKEEYTERINFDGLEKKTIAAAEPSVSLSLVPEPEPQNELLFSGDGNPVEYLYFFRKTCPNCPPVANWLERSSLEGRRIDVDRESGMHEAGIYDITAAPTVVFLDSHGQETGRGNNVAALEAQIGLTAVAGA